MSGIHASGSTNNVLVQNSTDCCSSFCNGSNSSCDGFDCLDVFLELICLQICFSFGICGITLDEFIILIIRMKNFNTSEVYYKDIDLLKRFVKNL